MSKSPRRLKNDDDDDDDDGGGLTQKGRNTMQRSGSGVKECRTVTRNVGQ